MGGVHGVRRRDRNDPRLFICLRMAACGGVEPPAVASSMLDEAERRLGQSAEASGAAESA